MPTKLVAIASLALLGLGGPLLVFGLPDVGWAARAGVGALWLGSLAAILLILKLLRDGQRTASTQARDLRTLARGAGGSAELPGPLATRFDEERAHLDGQLAAQQREILRIIDARLLGLHESLREQAGDGA